MRRHPAPWLFGVINLPYGIFSGLTTTTLPFLLRQRGLTVERIAEIIAMIGLPLVWYFLWSPIVDIGLRRRAWLIVVAMVSAAGFVAAMVVPISSSTALLTALLVVACAANQLVSSAHGGLIAETMPNDLRGAVAGWSQAANLGGGAAAGGFLIWIAARSPLAVAAAIGGLLIALPSLPALAIDEPAPAGRTFREHARLMLRDLRQSLDNRRVWLGFALFVSPIGAGALLFLFSALADDFHAASGVVIWFIGIGSGLLTAVGAFIGGFVCDRFDRWVVYPVAGLLSAACAAAMALAPLTPQPYAIGASAYALATGFGYAAFSSLALELTGEGGAAASTRVTLFVAAANVPLLYMTWFDGMGHGRFGVRGLLAVDAILGAAASAIVLAVILQTRRAGRATRAGLR